MGPALEELAVLGMIFGFFAVVAIVCFIGYLVVERVTRK